MIEESEVVNEEPNELIFNPVNPWDNNGEKKSNEKSNEKSNDKYERIPPYHSFRPSKENILKALEVAGGHTSNAAEMFTYPDGRKVPKSTFHNWMTSYDIIKYPRTVKVEMARTCLSVLYKKAVKNGDIRAIENILNKWGKFIDFENETDNLQINQAVMCQKLSDTYEE